MLADNLWRVWPTLKWLNLSTKIKLDWTSFLFTIIRKSQVKPVSSLYINILLISNDPVDFIVAEAPMFNDTMGTVSGTDIVGGTDPNLEDQNLGEGRMEIDPTSPENIPTFRHNALVVATYPWASGIVMAPTLSNIFDKNHFGYVS